MADEVEHRFVAEVRPGLVAAGVVPGGTTVRVELDGAAPVDVVVAIDGPERVAGLDPAAVTRMVPPPGTTDFEPNLFAAIELAHPALPWMSSPARTPRLPWMVLVVIAEQPGVTVTGTARGTVISIDAPAVLARELPDLTEAWAWVHAHTIGAAGAAITPAELSHSRDASCARLVCPRRLEPRRRYHAALVPAFAAGIRAALGEAPEASDALAWTATTPLPLRLPAYRAWSFSTGDGGDFASLARALVARTIPAEAGVAAVDASAPGWGLADQAERVVLDGGVLRPIDAAAPTQPVATAALGAAIGDAIDAAAAPVSVPTLAPPLYGGNAIGATRTLGGPAWLERVNRDPRLRIAAGRGAELVRRMQDELVEAAWRELGDGEAANRLVRQGELAAVAGARLRARYLEPLHDAELVAVTRPAHHRFRLDDAPAGRPPRPTLAAAIDASALPTHAVSAAFRRIARPGGRAARAAGSGVGGELIDRANRAALAIVPPPRLPDGIAALDATSLAEGIAPRFSSARPAVIDDSAAHWRSTVVDRVAPTTGTTTVALARRRETHVPPEEIDWVPAPPSMDDALDPIVIDEFAAAARAHQQYLVEHLGAIRRRPPRRPLAGGALAAARARFMAAAAPMAGLVPEMRARLDGPAVPAGLRPVTIEPTFDQPLLHRLRALGPGALLPGLTGVPADTVALLAPDHDAVAALLLGANHELASELAWRGFPGPPGASPLRCFWGRIAVRPDGQLVRLPDIPAVAAWPSAGPPPPPVHLVLLVRGELLRRYPNAIAYLAPARWHHAHRVLGTGASRAPLVQASLGADTAIYGFDLDAATVAGADRPGPAGWYVVIEEHPQEPRFGLGAGPDRPLTTWRDLTWTRVTPGDVRGDHLVVGGPLAALQPTTPAGLRWGADSAQLAAITLRRPTRIAIHGSRLVRPAAPEPS